MLELADLDEVAGERTSHNDWPGRRWNCTTAVAAQGAVAGAMPRMVQFLLLLSLVILIGFKFLVTNAAVVGLELLCE